jgi:hypothetical protein
MNKRFVQVHQHTPPVRGARDKIHIATRVNYGNGDIQTVNSTYLSKKRHRGVVLDTLPAGKKRSATALSYASGITCQSRQLMCSTMMILYRGILHPRQKRVYVYILHPPLLFFKVTKRRSSGCQTCDPHLTGASDTVDSSGHLVGQGSKPQYAHQTPIIPQQ